MFAWYQVSRVCYVYLSDVYVHPKMHASGEGVDVASPSIFQQIKASRWVTRGWTLQELIAPPFLVFISSDWQELGTKADHATFLSEITHIPIEVLLMENPLSSYSVAQRMSWASKRRTTRVEDEAYCLFGLFGINMPTLYGE